MKNFKRAVKYFSLPVLVISSGSAFAEANSTIIDAIAPSITNASDTAVAIILLFLAASIAVTAGFWAWGLARKGKSV